MDQDPGRGRLLPRWPGELPDVDAGGPGWGWNGALSEKRSQGQAGVAVSEDLGHLMAAALDQAAKAAEKGEVPIGAVVAIGGAIVGRGFNQPILAGDPTAHAEIVAIRAAARHVGNYRLTGATLCVTIEPCLMCVGALVHARIGLLVYGATEPRSGAVVSMVKGGDLPGHNHRFEVTSGVREQDCRELVQAFFRSRR